MLNNIRNRYLLLSDLLLLGLAPFLAYTLRFEGLDWGADHLDTAVWFTALAVPVKVGLVYGFGLYARLWRHASVADLGKITETGVAAGLASMLLGLAILPGLGLTPGRVPISVVAMDAFFTLSAIAGSRLLLKTLDRRNRIRSAPTGKRVLIVGAGRAGEMILKELVGNSQIGLTPIGFADDDPAKRNHRLGDVPVLGSLDEIPELIRRHQIAEILIAMPTAAGTVVRRVLRAAMDAKVPARTVPGLFEIVTGRVGVSNLRKVEIQDLLRREPVETDLDAVGSIVTDRTVLVTGAGGSIGSELARQVASLNPRHLVLLGNAENEIFDILHELQARDRRLVMTPLIADVRDRKRMQAVFRTHHPYTVFHAAAHKHVPLMEENVGEAVTNNVVGTRNMVSCAIDENTEHFVFISTDKAVRPTSVMGTTKRAAEMILQDAALRHGRHFVSVRFGNVLGSRGSVVPTFMRQIREGGPVTITSAEMERYFMTIPEAVQLVMQAGAQGRGGEVFVLDMGEPIRIVDLATDLIRLSGLDVGRDIEIRYTGSRPGERLYEEMFFRGEDVVPTEHPKILRATNHHLSLDIEEPLRHLIDAAQECCADDDVRRLLRVLVPDFGQSAISSRALSQRARRARRSRPSSAHPNVRSGSERRSESDRRSPERRQQNAPIVHDDRRSSSDRRSPGDRRSSIERRADEPTPAKKLAATARS